MGIWQLARGIFAEKPLHVVFCCGISILLGVIDTHVLKYNT